MKTHNMIPPKEIVLSGMRPTGALHLGHYYGALVNWVHLQDTHQCYFMVADCHALTTHYQSPIDIENHIREMVIDWIACGLDTKRSTLFVQSWVPQHAELFLILSMIAPLSWLERVPTYKEQQEKLSAQDLTTYGFLGYPVLQAADILLYGASVVPVGEDQQAHVELTRELARRFNHFYGTDPDYQKKARLAEKKLIAHSPQASNFAQLKQAYLEKGENEALEKAQALITTCSALTHEEKERLRGALRGGGRMILSDPQARLTAEARLPGLDGQKMSKSYHNTLPLRAENDDIQKRIRKMKTDPNRIRLTDRGNPDQCPVWDFHRIYSDTTTQAWVREGCTQASIGCLQCKQPIVDAIIEFMTPLRERAKPLLDDPYIVETILKEGSEKARHTAESTMKDVRTAIGLRQAYF